MPDYGEDWWNHIPEMDRSTPISEERRKELIEEAKKEGRIYKDPYEGMIRRDRIKAITEDQSKKKREREAELGIKRGENGRGFAKGTKQDGVEKRKKRLKPQLQRYLRELAALSPNQFRDKKDKWVTMNEKAAWLLLNEATQGAKDAKGWATATKELWERLEGKVKEEVNHTIDLGKTIVISKGSPVRKELPEDTAEDAEFEVKE